MSLRSLKKVGLAALISVPLIFSGCSQKDPDYIERMGKTKIVINYDKMPDAACSFQEKEDVIREALLRAANNPFVQLAEIDPNFVGQWNWYGNTRREMYLKKRGPNVSPVFFSGNDTPDYFVFFRVSPKDPNKFTIDFFMDDDAAKEGTKLALSDFCFSNRGYYPGKQIREYIWEKYGKLKFKKLCKGVYTASYEGEFNKDYEGTRQMIGLFRSPKGKPWNYNSNDGANGDLMRLLNVDTRAR